MSHLPKITAIQGSTTVDEMYKRIDAVQTDRYELLQYQHVSESHIVKIGMSRKELLAEMSSQLPGFCRTDFVLIEYPEPVPNNAI